MEQPPEPWCGRDALKALHEGAAKQCFVGATYTHTAYDVDFNLWATYYTDARGGEHMIAELWVDPSGKTGRVAMTKNANPTLH